MGWGHLLHSNAPHGPLDSRWSRGLGRRGRGVGVTVCRPAGLGQEAVVIALDHLGALGGAGLLPVVKLVLAVRQAVFDGRWRRATTEGTDIGVLMTSVYMRIAVRRRQPEACPHKEQVMLGVQRSWTYSATQSRTHWTKTHGRQVGLHRSGLSGADTHHVCFWGVSSRDDHLFTINIKIKKKKKRVRGASPLVLRSTFSLGATGSSVPADRSISLPDSDVSPLTEGPFLVVEALNCRVVCLPVLDAAEEGRLCYLNVTAFSRAGQWSATWRLFYVGCGIAYIGVY